MTLKRGVQPPMMRSWAVRIYLDHNAKMQYQAMMMAGPNGSIVYMDEAEVDANVVWQEYVRSWDLWKKKWQPRLAAEKALRKG